MNFLFFSLGQGMDKLLELINDAAVEFETDYRVEWERMKLEKLKLKEEEDSAEAAQQSQSQGQPVSLITEISASRELADIFIRHPGDESEEGSGEEEGAEVNENEEETFSQFVEKHKKASEKNKTGN